MKKIYLILFTASTFTLYTKAQPDSSKVLVRISYIDAVSNNASNKLYWRTACFLLYANFEIQRSYDAVNYNTINTFSADQLRCQQPFEYQDFTASQFVGRVYYRLKVGSMDGRVYNSKIVAVFTNGEGIEINSFAPTIVSTSATLSISSSAKEDAVIAIINAQGTFLKQHQVKLVKGVNVV